MGMTGDYEVAIEEGATYVRSEPAFLETETITRKERRILWLLILLEVF